MKKFTIKFLYTNIEIYNFFFPFNKNLINIHSNKKKFVVCLNLLWKNFPINLKIKFSLFLIFIQVLPIFYYLKFFHFLTLNQKKNFIQKLKNYKIQILIKGLLAIKSQSIIIYYSIFKGNINYD